MNAFLSSKIFSIETFSNGLNNILGEGSKTTELKADHDCVFFWSSIEWNIKSW